MIKTLSWNCPYWQINYWGEWSWMCVHESCPSVQLLTFIGRWKKCVHIRPQTILLRRRIVNVCPWIMFQCPVVNIHWPMINATQTHQHGWGVKAADQWQWVASWQGTNGPCKGQHTLFQCPPSPVGGRLWTRQRQWLRHLVTGGGKCPGIYVASVRS